MVGEDQDTEASVKITYMQNQFAIHEQIASGEIEGKKFTVHHNFGRVYVRFAKLKGQIPNLGVNIKDLVESAYEIAVKENLLNN